MARIRIQTRNPCDRLSYTIETLRGFTICNMINRKKKASIRIIQYKIASVLIVRVTFHLVKSTWLATKILNFLKKAGGGTKKQMLV